MFENIEDAIKIEEKIPFTQVEWSKDSEKLITLVGSSIRLTVYDIYKQKSRSFVDLRHVKRPFKISPDGNFIACLLDFDNKDHIGFIRTDSLQIFNCFELETKNAGSLVWSKDSDFIMVKEDLFDTMILIYCINGFLLRRFSKNSFNDSIERVFISKAFNIVLFYGFSKQLYIRDFKKGINKSGFFLKSLLECCKNMKVLEETNNGKKFPDRVRKCKLNSNKTKTIELFPSK